LLGMSLWALHVHMNKQSNEYPAQIILMNAKLAVSLI
jgi:hypothetical protein